MNFFKKKKKLISLKYFNGSQLLTTHTILGLKLKYVYGNK